MLAGFTSPLIHSLNWSGGIGLPSNAAWLARYFGWSSQVQLSGNSPAEAGSTPRTSAPRAMGNDSFVLMEVWLARAWMADNSESRVKGVGLNLLHGAVGRDGWRLP